MVQKSLSSDTGQSPSRFSAEAKTSLQPLGLQRSPLVRSDLKCMRKLPKCRLNPCNRSFPLPKRQRIPLAPQDLCKDTMKNISYLIKENNSCIMKVVFKRALMMMMMMMMMVMMMMVMMMMMMMMMIPMLAMCAFVIELISINNVSGSICSRDGDGSWYL